MAKKNQRLNTFPLVAIDLGSNGIRAMAAESLGPNMLHILGVEQSSLHPCVDRGIVIQNTSAGFMIGDILKKLANRIHVPELPAAFTMLGGRSMKVVSVSSKRDLLRYRTIPSSMYSEMEQECKQKIESHNPTVAVLGLIPSYYVLDGKEQEEHPLPSDRATLLEIHYTAFVGAKDLEQKVQESFARAAILIEHAFVRQDALLSAFATDDESIWSDGCAIIDFGDQTTTFSVFKQGQYLTTKVIPIGGWNITRNIEQQGIRWNIAETLKCQYGYAAPELVEQNLKISIPGTELSFNSRELAATIQMKVDEILAPILDELKKYEERISVVYITGGGSLLNGLCDYIQSQTPLRVDFGSHAGLLDRSTPDEYCSPEYSSLVGTLIMGTDYRAEHGDDVLPGKDSLIRKIKEQFTQTTLDFFTSQNE